MSAWRNHAPQQCSLVAEGSAHTLPFLRSSEEKHQPTYSQWLMVYWVTNGADPCIELNGVVAHVGTSCRANGLHFFCPHKEKCVPSAPKRALRATFWTTWTAATNRSRDAQRWTKTQWGTHLDDLNGLLKIATQHWLRRLWGFVQKPVPSVLQEGSWIYVLWSPRTPYVYVGQTGAMKGTRCCLPGTSSTYGAEGHGRHSLGRKEYGDWESYTQKCLNVAHTRLELCR